MVFCFYAFAIFAIIPQNLNKKYIGENKYDILTENLNFYKNINEEKNIYKFNPKYCYFITDICYGNTDKCYSFLRNKTNYICKKTILDEENKTDETNEL